ncbi:hypothetical protein SAMN05421780_11511 [Flexibacter flexilis DSM 6793]|uniref:Uncharacterized protein n=1 Tax=Flexibacter flexilis DSM 6793 TaxID=927664 RepID=A0A1I1NH08_9BACT|nr:hypothetical protein SAMN05421780_11511 [Flexibacter flexilis DSM 6793]
MMDADGEITAAIVNELTSSKLKVTTIEDGVTATFTFAAQ